MTFDATLNADLEAVSQFSTRLESELSGLSVEARTSVLLAVQELLVNIVRHAYAGAQGQIIFEMKRAASSMQITITDFAENSFTLPDKITMPDPLELPESGMGLYIIYQTFDSVTYERRQNSNRWQLKKSLGG